MTRWRERASGPDGGDDRVGGDRVGVVTDSTACLTDELLAPYSAVVRVVPLNVTLDDATYVEGEDVTSDEVVAAQEAGVSVTTSRPSPARFVEAYRELADVGCTSIVSLHASAALSSTMSSAQLAGVESPVPVEVIDSRTIGMALGFGVLEAARVAVDGGDRDDVAQAATRTFESSRTAFYVDSLEPLRRGGRIGRAGAIFGSALSIKPLLHVHDGGIAPLARVRSSQKAISRLAQWALTQAESMSDSRVCAVHSLERQDLAASLVRQVSVPAEGENSDDGVPGVTMRWAVGPVAAPLGAVVTAHVGAGAVAVVVADPRAGAGGDDSGHVDVSESELREGNAVSQMAGPSDEPGPSTGEDGDERSSEVVEG